LTLSEFNGMWGGKALVTSVGKASKLELASLQTSKGGTGLVPLPPGYPVPGSTGPSSPISNTSIHAPGVDPRIDLFNTSLAMTETDIAVKSLGDLSLVFNRVYYNEKGYHRSEYTGTNVWQNNIGAGWTHSLNMHLECSTGSPPTVIIFYDETGTARAYNYDSDVLGFHRYYRSSTGQTAERGNVLYQNASTHVFNLYLPDGTEYMFSTPTSDDYCYARLTGIVWIKAAIRLR